jgi:pantoate kinase
LVEEIPEIGDLDWELDIIMSLPTSQGFGMSASGAVASSMAIQRAIGIPHEECVRRSFLVAHIVERKRSSGLGDTTALSSGGVERRVAAGSPFSGSLLDNGPGVSQGWSVEIPILISWKEKTGRHTSSYIDSEDWRRKICRAGELAMERIAEGEWKEHRWPELIEESLRFSSESGLEMDASRLEIIESVNKAIDSSGFSDSLSAMLCMLGESVVIVPNDPNGKKDWIYKISEELEGYGLSSFSSRVGELR